MLRFIACLSTLLSAAAFAQAEPAAAPAPKLAVLPFAALSGEVPPRAGQKAAGMLSTEFKNAEGVQLVDMKKATAADPHAEALASARKLVDEARELRKKKKFRLADEALKKAIETYKKEAAGITDIAEVVDAWALLSAIEFNTGRDEEGQKSLATALALAPARDLPLAATSALFARVVADTKKALTDAPKGTLQVETSPSGAGLMIDGLVLGGSPLSVKEVPVGLHFWRATLPNSQTLGGVVDVAAGKVTKVSGSSTTKDPESRLLSSLAQNKLDAELMGAAKELAAAAGSDWVLFGALSKEGKGLGLDTFLYSAQGAEVRRLPHARFDTELLSAGMELYNVAGGVLSKGIKVGEAVKVPSSVAPSLQAAGGVKVAEVKYGVQPGKDAADVGVELTEPVKDEGPRKPLGDGKRKPLKK